jgi:hypothetical protein
MSGACSSDVLPQPDNKIQNRINGNPRLNFLDKNIISLLLLLSGFNETNKISIYRLENKKTMPLPLALFNGIKRC